MIEKKLFAGCLNWNGCHEKHDGTVKHVSAAALHHTIENNTNVHHAEKNKFAQRKQTDNFNKMMSMCGIAIMNKTMDKI